MRKYVVIESATVKDALVAINNITHDGELLIVVNSDQQMVGSLTDGDIRRGVRSCIVISSSSRRRNMMLRI